MIEETTTKVITCKHCNSDLIVKFGTYKGVQRYYCKSCKRKFKNDDTQFHEKVPSQYITRAVSEYFSGMSINDIRSTLKQEHGYYPSKSIVFKWINKYTDLARKQFQDCHPQVGNTWIADETMLDIDGQHKVWFYDIIDEKTRFLLASRVAVSRKTNEAQLVMEEAGKRAGKTPETVITDSNNSYMDGIYQAFNGNVDHIQSYPTAKENDTQRIERFHETLKDRTKIFKAFRDTETLIQFTDGWLVYYNYFKPHQSLNGKTPAEEAKIDYPVKNWADLARVPVSKESEIQTHKIPLTRTPKAKIDLTKALKRRREGGHFGSTHLSQNWREERRLEKGISSKSRLLPRMPRITPKPMRLNAPQHYSKRGGGLTRRSDI
jgi:putative transposase